MERRQAKHALYEAIAVMGKALASPVRLELIDLLVQSPRGVDELARLSGQSVANTSQHLQALHSAGIVSRMRDGTRIRYALAGDDAVRLWLTLRDTSVSHLAEVERAARSYLGGDVEAIGRDELDERLSHGDLVLLDVRPDEEFAAGHIPDARSIPVDELEDRIDELPADAQIVAYCRGSYCVMSHDAVRLLRDRGRDAVALREGILEWRAAGQPVVAA